MSANITDYFNKASSMNGSYPPVATVSSARATGGSTLSCDDLSGWATDTPVHFSTFQVAADGTIDTATQTDWKGIVVGNTITEMTRLAGAADSGNASGDRVELNPTIGWLDDLITGILVSHKQNGGLKDSIVTESTIAGSAVTSGKIASNAVTEAKIATDAVTSGKIKNGAVTAAKIDFTTLKWDQVATIGDYNNTPIKIKVLSGTMPSSLNTWKNIGSIGSGHTVLGAVGSFIEGTTNYPFPGTSASENNVIYIDGNGAVNVKSDYNFALSKPCKVSVIYV